MNKQKNKTKNEKMDCFVNSKTDKEAIYEIYRSCRLCGAGAGYKMPIIQCVVNLVHNDIELKEKIRECVQIEVDHEDRMPPLICELCVDKVQDFYEFLQMCRNTNKRTRLRLGLPLQTLSRDMNDAEDCILGISEPIFLKNEPNSKRNIKKSKLSKEVEGKDVSGKKKVKADKSNRLSRELQQLLKGEMFIQRYSTKQTSQLITRGKANINIVKEQRRKAAPTPAPKPIPKKKAGADTKLKRQRDRDAVAKQETQSKKVKILDHTPKEGHMFACSLCSRAFENRISLGNHKRAHKVLPKVLPKSKVLDVKVQPAKQPKDICTHCGKTLSSLRSLRAHHATCKCKPLSRHQLYLRRRMTPVRIRVMRCDPLLRRGDDGHYDVSNVRVPYGLDENCIYPYLPKRGSLLSDNKMVDIKEEIAEFHLDRAYIHWDSDTDESDDIYIDKRKNVESLATLTLKTIFSKNCLGKVPKRVRRIKAHELMLGGDADGDFRLDIDDVMHRLGDGADDTMNIRISNVVSQKDSDYDSDRTSFNEEFEVLNKLDQTSKGPDLNDADSVDSNLGLTRLNGDVEGDRADLSRAKLDLESELETNGVGESHGVNKDGEMDGVRENVERVNEDLEEKKIVEDASHTIRESVFGEDDIFDLPSHNSKDEDAPDIDVIFDRLKNQSDMSVESNVSKNTTADKGEIGTIVTEQSNYTYRNTQDINTMLDRESSEDTDLQRDTKAINGDINTVELSRNTSDVNRTIENSTTGPSDDELGTNDDKSIINEESQLKLKENFKADSHTASELVKLIATCEGKRRDRTGYNDNCQSDESLHRKNDDLKLNYNEIIENTDQSGDDVAKSSDLKDLKQCDSSKDKLAGDVRHVGPDERGDAFSHTFTDADLEDISDTEFDDGDITGAIDGQIDEKSGDTTKDY